MIKKQKSAKLSTANWIVKSNALNEIRNNRMSISQIRFFSIYLSKVNPKDPKSREVTFKLDEYTKIMQFKQANTTRLMKTADELLGLIVTYYDKDGTYSSDGLIGFTKCQIFKRFKLFRGGDNDEWYVTIDCHDDVLKLMFELRGYYFKYQLWNALQLTSTNQQRMYEILKQYENVGAREISVNDLREFLGITTEEYPRWDNFKTRILEASQEALANYTDIKFTWEVTGKRGKGGKINKLKFNIEKNNDYVQQLTLDEYLTGMEPLEIENELVAFESENESLPFLSEACENTFDMRQVEELFFLVNRAVPYQKDRHTTEQERYKYLLEKYTYSKNRSTKPGKLFNYLKTVIEADINAAIE
jgi:plasmid replication initiation protein